MQNEMENTYEIITNENEFENLENNSFKGKIPEMINSTITFKGSNNLLYCERDVVLENCNLCFYYDNSIIYLSKSRYNYHVNVSVHYDSLVYIGRNNFIKENINIVASEGKHIVIGSDGLYSDNITIRTADPHLIYRAADKKRLNYSKNVFIGDHVWISQSVFVLKGTCIGSGSIIGAASVLSSKKVPSNTSFAGNPAKMIGKDIFYDKTSVHHFTKEDTKNSKFYGAENPDPDFDPNKFLYEYAEDEQFDFSSIDKPMRSTSIKKKLEFIKEEISKKPYKNRFFVPLPKEQKKNLVYYIRKFLRRIIGI